VTCAFDPESAMVQFELPYGVGGPPSVYSMACAPHAPVRHHTSGSLSSPWRRASGRSSTQKRSCAIR
jgi:hypothetical protein